MKKASNSLKKGLRKLLSDLPGELYIRYDSIEKKATKDFLPFTQPPDFTDHGIKHSMNVQENLKRLIPERIPNPLTPFEIFALLSASLLHDVGMVISKSSDETSFDIRVDHYNRSREFILKTHKELNLSEHEAAIIGEICRSHGMANLEYLDNKPFSLYGHGTVRVVLISALLRLADILDITAQRAPSTVADKRKMDNESQKHWDIHRRISDVQIETDPYWDIIIHAITENKTDEIQLYDLKNSIQKELDIVYPILRAAGIFFKKVELQLNNILTETRQKTLKNPFLQLKAYDSRNTNLFTGREKEHQKMIELISGRKVVVLIGESGVGKTSLVEAGVIPKLKTLKYGIIRFSFQNDPLGNLVNELHNFSKTKSKVETKKNQENVSSRDLLGAVCKTLKKGKSKIQRLLIIGDHLEQMFTFSISDEFKNDFIKQVQRVLGSSSLITFLFCIREDYLPDLYDLSQGIPELYDRSNTLRLYKLSGEQGKKVFERASQFARIKLSKPIIEQIIGDICDEGEGMIYPPFLQIIGYRLYAAMSKGSNGEYETSGKQLSLYKSMEGATTIVNRYLDSLLDSYPVELKPTVGRVLREMVTEHYTKRRVTKKYLQQVLPDCHELDKILRSLIQHRIVRRSLGEYELMHDFLARRVIELIENKSFLSPPVRKALEYIDKKYYKKGLTSSDIAKETGVTQMHLATLFQKQLGITINCQLNRIKIAKAKEMFSENRDPLTYVAKKTGFRSLSSFSRKFKEIEGITANTYRNELLEKIKKFDSKRN